MIVAPDLPVRDDDHYCQENKQIYDIYTLEEEFDLSTDTQPIFLPLETSCKVRCLSIKVI